MRKGEVRVLRGNDIYFGVESPQNFLSSCSLLRLLLLAHTANSPELMTGSSSILPALPTNNTVDSAPVRRRHRRLALLAGHDRPHAARQVRDVLVPALGAQLPQGLLQAQQVVHVGPARPLGPVDVLGQGLGGLRADELFVLGRADVRQGPDGFVRVCGWVEGRVVLCLFGLGGLLWRGLTGVDWEGGGKGLGKDVEGGG